MNDQGCALQDIYGMMSEWIHLIASGGHIVSIVSAAGNFASNPLLMTSGQKGAHEMDNMPIDMDEWFGLDPAIDNLNPGDKVKLLTEYTHDCGPFGTEIAPRGSIGVVAPAELQPDNPQFTEVFFNFEGETSPDWTIHTTDLQRVEVSND